MLESLTESTERAVAASWDSTGPIEALGGRITISIEEMGKSVTQNLCRALAEIMREVLVGVLKSKESVPEALPTEAKGVSGAKVADVVGEVAAQAGPTSGAAGGLSGGSNGASAAAVAGPSGAATGRVVVAKGSAAGDWAGAAVTNPSGPAMQKEGRAFGSSAVGGTGNDGEERAAPAFCGPGMLPVPMAQEIDEARGKKKVVEFEELGPEDHELSFADQEDWWMDLGPNGPDQN
ncbi:unnamed protein product [Linum trigynum]|uniref:Uncharacterized protein n=1 Tax=Linum trigynum TaxID=586398 RepID=A0AAV2E934_9ROSI